MEYDGPKHERVTKKLRRIARLHDMKLRFKPSVGLKAEYWVGDSLAILQLEVTERELVSNFFHELGHHLDYTSGLFRSFYSPKTPLYVQRKVSLKAERHADKIGERLCRKYFPKVKFRKSYRSREDIQFNRDYYADGRRTNPLTRTLMQGSL